MCVACWPGGKHAEAQVEKARNQHCHFVQVEKSNTTKTQELFWLLLLLVGGGFVVRCGGQKQLEALKLFELL